MSDTTVSDCILTVTITFDKIPLLEIDKRKEIQSIIKIAGNKFLDGLKLVILCVWIYFNFQGLPHLDMFILHNFIVNNIKRR